MINFISIKMFIGIIILFLAVQMRLLAGDNSIPKSNFIILDSLSSLAVKDFCNYIKKKQIDTACIRITPHPAKWLILNKIISEGKTNKLQFLNADSTKKYNFTMLEISIKDLSVKYSLYSDRDSLYRELNVNICGNMKNGNGTLEVIPDFKVIYFDKISRNDIDYVKSIQYDFANSQVPPVERTFFEEVTEPIILVASAAVTVLLLFTVRSK
ncbi:MAG: hypothetical protein ABSG15_10545 [FCB group bacterium]